MGVLLLRLEQHRHRTAARSLMLIRRRVDYSTSDINKLYEIWLRTRDAWVEKKLRQAGVIIGSGDPGTKVIQ